MQANRVFPLKLKSKTLYIMYEFILVITTCKQYYSNVKNLIEQINQYGFPKEKIVIVSGQEDINDMFYYDNIRIIKVKYTGLHHTGAMYVNANIGCFNNIKYWILLPDTIKFGKNFFNLFAIPSCLSIECNDFSILSIVIL